MAFSKSMLKGMGLSDEQVKAIIDSHMESVNSLQKQIDELETTNESLQKDSKKFEKLSKDYEELKKTISEAGNPYLTQYENEKKKHAETKAEYEKYKADVEAKEIENKKSNAYRKLLLGAGISDKLADQVLNLAKANKKLDSIEFGEDGEVKDTTKIIENIKADYAPFIQTVQNRGADTSTPISNVGGKMTKSDILAIKDTAERQQAMKDNRELFGF